MAYPNRGAWLFCCSVLLCMAGWSSAWASDSTSDEWSFTVAPYLWAVGMDGDVGLGRFKTSVNDSFIDIMQDSDSVMAFMGDFSASKGPWSFFVSPTWAKLGSDDESFGPIKADITETITIIGFGMKIPFGRVVSGGCAGRLTGVGEPNVHLRPARRRPLYAFRYRIGFQAYWNERQEQRLGRSLRWGSHPDRANRQTLLQGKG